MLVTIIYIATPNHSHERYTILALEHKKAVLCEKPFAINKKQVFKMIEASKNNAKFLMEAMWTRFNPSIKKIKSSIENGKIIINMPWNETNYFSIQLNNEAEKMIT